MAASGDNHAQRILVLMPTRLDAGRTAQFLRDVQIHAHTCVDLAEACQELRQGAGALLLTDEALLSDSAGQLAEAVRAQPAWSAVPILVLSRERAMPHLQRMSADAFRSLTIVERPVRTQTLQAMVASALRTRRHQYQIRDAFSELDRQAGELVARDEKLQFALSAGGLGSWELDLARQELTCSAQCKAHHGRAANEAFSYRDLQDAIHPDDETRVLAAITESLQRGADYDVEYRACKPSGDVRWLMARGRVAYDERGQAVRLAGVSLDITERKRLHDRIDRLGHTRRQTQSVRRWLRPPLYQADRRARPAQRAERARGSPRRSHARRAGQSVDTSGTRPT